MSKAKKEKKKTSTAWKIIRAILIAIAAVVLIVVGYFAYVFLAYSRIPDNQVLEPVKSELPESDIATGQEYRILSFNIGFGAYEPDYGFFMDGGTQSWAWSKERLDTNMKNITAFLQNQAPDFALIQEVDLNSTRSYHRDEREDVKAGLSGYSYSWAQNWDSPFLFYPLTRLGHEACRPGPLLQREPDRDGKREGISADQLPSFGLYLGRQDRGRADEACDFRYAGGI